LTEQVEKGLFRQDLFYRINVVRLQLPPLRKRREDIAALVKHFIERFNRLQGRLVTGISQEALSLLMFHDYPGNIRELENIIEHALVLCSEGEIGVHCLPENVQKLANQPPPARIDAARRLTEFQIIQESLKRNRFNRLATARDLGMHKSTLFRKIKQLGIQLPKTDGRSKKRNPE
jgi:DNA-binding NtrC family response regulator